MSKIIALLPFKNEEMFLESYMDSISNFCDSLVAYNDNSTDKSLEIINKFSDRIEIKIIDKNILEQSEIKQDWNVDVIRQQLLTTGRQLGGSHFVCLDADEVFTRQFINNARKIIDKLAPGQKIQLQWLTLWKSLTHYRDDNSVWSNNYKDFIFCDDGKISYKVPSYLCEARTPGSNEDDVTLKLNKKYGAVIHYQFAFWNLTQTKQAWYRCRELINGKNPYDINQKYKITLDDPTAKLRALDDSWVPAIMPKIAMYNPLEDWRFLEMLEFFKHHESVRFKELEISHVINLG
jgi:glycosyltransferase involved in cell wall biosynthesis